MSYVALRFLACLIGHPNQCELVEVSAPPLTTCWVHGQAVIASWLAQHDGYQWRGAYLCLEGKPA